MNFLLPTSYFLLLTSYFLLPTSEVRCQNSDLTPQSSYLKDINNTDEKGNKQGYWRKTDEKGILKYEGRFINNIPVDTFKYYYSDGKKIKDISGYSNNGLNMKSKMLYENGKIMSEGFYTKDTSMSKTLNYKKDSIWKYFNDTGTLIAEEFYKNNKKDGVWKTYYDNAKLNEEITWKDDVKNGLWKQYFEDGTLKLSANLKNNLFNGPFKVFYSSGLIMMSGLYSEGLKEGRWIYYKETMEILKTEDYKHGELIIHK